MILEKLIEKKLRCDELNMMLSQPDAMKDQANWRKMLKEQSDLVPIVTLHDKYTSLLVAIEDADEALRSGDEDMEQLGKEELAELLPKKDALEEEVRLALAPSDPNDGKNVILEIRAGTGGDEAALFATTLLRMYMRYAELQKWKCTITNINENDIGGCKEVVAMIEGDNVFSRLKFESGAHRVQRIPETESSGRIHTSAATVAVLPEAEDVEIDISPVDLRIDVFRSSGAGGQHVNTTDSAVRITHLPTGVVVECQDERSQIKNRVKAMSVLKSRLLDFAQSAAEKEYSQMRRVQIGTGDRSERIRTYNFPQGRITDHRIGKTLYKLNSFIDGDMDEMINELILADKMVRMGSE